MKDNEKIIDTVKEPNEQLLFYIQALSEQARLDQDYKPSPIKKGNEKMVDIPLQQKDLQDAKRKVIGKIMIEYEQLGIVEPGSNSTDFDGIANNPNIRKLAEGELKYVKTPIDYKTFIKDVINCLDQMMFLRRSSGEGDPKYEVEDQTDKLKLFIAKEFRKAKSFTFKDVKQRIRECYHNLYSEEYIFRLLQLLAQQGLLQQQHDNNSYCFLDSLY